MVQKYIVSIFSTQMAECPVYKKHKQKYINIKMLTVFLNLWGTLDIVYKVAGIK
jgi:hypothetical protein